MLSKRLFINCCYDFCRCYKENRNIYSYLSIYYIEKGKCHKLFVFPPPDAYMKIKPCDIRIHMILFLIHYVFHY